MQIFRVTLNFIGIICFSLCPYCSKVFRFFDSEIFILHGCCHMYDEIHSHIELEAMK